MFNQPLGGNEMPRFGGPNTFMRLPASEDLDALDVAFLGVPMDIGASWRSGTRFGPKAIRAESAMIRPYNMGTGAAPFDVLNCGDIGDVAINTFDLKDSVLRIETHLSRVFGAGVKPMTMGGDHTLTLPVLRAAAAKHGPVALVHVDAHADINDRMFGETIAHGTPFRRAYEEGLLQPEHVWQIGLRGTGYSAQDFDEALGWGFNVVTCDTIWQQSLRPLAEQIRNSLGDRPVYLSFDIDSLDPAYAPGTGTPEIAGLTPPQALQLIRGLRGVNLVGCDLVEVSPPYDPSGNTALTAANLLYEMLCVLPGV